MNKLHFPVSVFSYTPFFLVLIGFLTGNLSVDLTILMLFIGLLILLPSRDFIFDDFKRRKFPDPRRILFAYINKISGLKTEKDILFLVKQVHSELNMGRAYFSFLFPEPKLICFENSTLKQFSNKASTRFINVIRKKPHTYNHADNHIAWIPYRNSELLFLYFRMQFVGFFLIRKSDKKLCGKLFEALASKVSLFLETQQTKLSKADLHEYNREIQIAHKVQNYLVKKKPQNIFNYEIRLVESSWNRKYFPSIFEVSKGASEQYFAILVRFSPASRRLEPFNLFSVQGHFLGLAPDADSLTALALQLQKVLLRQEKEKIQLEGYLFSLSEGKLRYCWFGEEMRFSVDSRARYLRPCAPLGDKDFHLSTTTLYHFNRIDFFLRDLPMILISSTASRLVSE
jgi:hypothetical protein